MKGRVWLSVGLGISLGLWGCSGSEDDDNSGDGMALDGGATGNFGAQITDLQNQFNTLNNQLGTLNTRADQLSAPQTPGSCSAGELCIPDGLNLAQTGVMPIISALCAREVTCCDTNELNYLYGAAVRTAADCEDGFADMIRKANTNASGGVFGAYGTEVDVSAIVRIAHALNDTDVLVQVNTEGVAACAASITGTACPTWSEGSSCSPSVVDSPCSLDKLLRGLERDGDPCEPGILNECGEGLTCRVAPSSLLSEGELPSGQAGLCAPKAAAGERCIRDSDCDDLYCDPADGTCKVRAKLGEPCSFVDPSFEHVGPLDPSSGMPGIGAATRIDCERGLTCNPVSNSCVPAQCSEGSFCQVSWECGDGLVCSNMGSPALQAYSDAHDSFRGLCVPPVAEGGACSPDSPYENECASQRCTDPDQDGAYTCAAGAGRCDFHCAVGEGCRECPEGQFCSSSSLCMPLIANGQPAGNSGTSVPNYWGCQSGHASTTTCVEPLASGAPCSVTAQCPSGEACIAGFCAAGAALNETCSPAGYASNCANNAYCWNHSTTGTDLRCATLTPNNQLHGLPNGAACSGIGDWCVSGYCLYNMAHGAYECGEPLAIGAACDPTMPSSSRCIEGSYCDPGEVANVGTCTGLLQGGEVCDPAHGGIDCASGACEYLRESFVCRPSEGDGPFCRARGD